MVCEDRISNLPPDILIFIISRLTLQEAISTSILSTSWRHLYTYIPQLNFPTYIDEIDNLSNYVSKVDRVLNSHRGSQIKEFRLSMEGYRGNFVSWFKFALTKKAEIIHITMYQDLKGLDFLRLPNARNGLKCLKDLSLDGLQCTDQDFELLVSNCLVLECLTVQSSHKLKNVSIVGLSKLKYLNLSYLWEVTSIVIHDVISLVSLTCCEWKSGCRVQLSNIPKLTKLDLGDSFDKIITNVEFLAGLPSCIRDQLQLLRLSSFSVSMYQVNLGLFNNLSIQLVNIKQLEMVLDTNDSCWYSRHTLHSSWYNFSCYTRRLVESCGSLEKLVIKFLHKTLPVRWKELKVEAYDHFDYDLFQKYLKVSGYSGSSLDRKLTLDLINNAKLLQNVIVVCCDENALASAQRDFRHVTSVNVLVI